MSYYVVKLNFVNKIIFKLFSICHLPFTINYLLLFCYNLLLITLVFLSYYFKIL